jgi:hypothetical protein
MVFPFSGGNISNDIRVSFAWRMWSITFMFYYGCLSKTCRFCFFKGLPDSLASSIIYLMKLSNPCSVENKYINPNMGNLRRKTGLQT